MTPGLPVTILKYRFFWSTKSLTLTHTPKKPMAKPMTFPSWMGINEQSKGVCVYWPDKKNVTVERNVYYDQMYTSVSHFKGEYWDGFSDAHGVPVG